MIATVIGIGILMVVGIPVIGVVLTVAITFAIGGYLLGIPWALWFRITHGRWPQS
jgi:hypothetical protein